MEKEFVPYELAVKLKELGFNEPCLACYLDNVFVIKLQSQNSEFEYFNNTTFSFNEKSFSAPLWQQAFDWFREKYDMQLGICHINGGFDCWTNDGDLFENGKYCNFKTYEEAELECLKKLIEIVKNK